MSQIIEPKYRTSAILLHWLTVLAIVCAVPLGKMLEHPPQGWGDALYRLHWSFGMLVLYLAVLRLANRLIGGAPPPYAGLTPVERLVSGAVHHLLYLMLFVVPLLGWLGKSAYGGEITIFGLFSMPALIGQDEALSKTLLGAHKLAVKVLIGCVVLHVAGAMNHLIIRRDGVMRRMLPGK